jgi:hypothetical protein
MTGRDCIDVETNCQSDGDDRSIVVVVVVGRAEAGETLSGRLRRSYWYDTLCAA